jgi:hypothetical protein
METALTFARSNKQVKSDNARKQYNRLKQAEYRANKRALKSKKLPSPFQQNKQNQLLKLLINPRSFVPVPTKLKHPIIKN